MRLLTSLVIFLGPALVRAQVRTQAVQYRHGEVVLEGHLAYDDARPGRRPGVLIVHDWTGVNPETQRRARMLSEVLAPPR